MKDTYTLSNGIKVVSERATQFNTVSLGIFINTGAAYETPANKGIAHMIEHMLFKGTKTRTALDISRESACLGDDINAYTSKEYTVLYGTTLTGSFPKMLDLLSDMISNSVFDEKDIEKEKQIILEEIAMYDDSPDDLVHDKLCEAVWKDHPLGYLISGAEETVKSLTRNGILAFLAKFYTAKNMVISVAGGFGDEMPEMLENAFGHITPGEERTSLLTGPVYYKSMLYVKRKIGRLHMNFAFPCITADSDERYTGCVFQAAFGGSGNSVLFHKIREELSLAYSVFSYGTSHKKAGLLQIDVIVNPDEAIRTLSEILNVIKQVKTEGFTQEQIENFKEQAVIELIMNGEGVRDKMEINAKQLLILSKLLNNDEQAAAIKRVTEDDIREFAGKYLDLNKMSVCLVGECGRRQIKQIEHILSEYRE